MAADLPSEKILQNQYMRIILVEILMWSIDSAYDRESSARPSIPSHWSGSGAYRPEFDMSEAQCCGP